MSSPTTARYTDAKAKLERALGRVATFVKASYEYDKDKRVKVGQMLGELT